MYYIILKTKTIKTNLFFDFKVDEKTSTIIVKRSFKATNKLVWDAWTKAEILDQWWAPEGWKSTTKAMKFKEGGMRHYQMQGPENSEMWGITSYLKITLHSKFSGKEYSSDMHAEISTELPPSDYHITFTDQDEQTMIEHHTTYNSLEDLKQSLAYGFKEGMLGAFERLDAFLE